MKASDAPLYEITINTGSVEITINTAPTFGLGDVMVHYPELRCGAAIQPLLKVDRLCFLVPGFFAV